MDHRHQEEVREEVYKEALYSVLHRFAKSDFRKEDLYLFLKDAFAFDEDKHYQLLTVIGQEEKPVVCVEVLVDRAENLLAKDPNGLSDPYCMLGIQLGKDSQESTEDKSNISAKALVTTTVQKATLNPVWHQTFTLEVDDIDVDHLHLDIWDEDSEKCNVMSSASQVIEVASLRGLGRFFKQIAQSTKGAAQDDFLGCVTIPIQSVGSTGLLDWFNLESRFRSGSAVRGRVRLELRLRCARRRGAVLDTVISSVAVSLVYEKLLTIFIEQQLQHAQDTQKWSGFIPAQATAILEQITLQGNLSSFQRALSRWAVFARLSTERQLDFALLFDVLQVVNTEWSKVKFHTIDQVESAQDSFSLFIKYCLRLMREHRKIWPLGMSRSTATMKNMLRCLGLIRHMKALQSVLASNLSLIDKNVGQQDDVNEDNLQKCAEAALGEGTQEWVQMQLAARQTLKAETDAKIQNFIDLMADIQQDLNLGDRYYNPSFLSELRVNYTRIVYNHFELGLEEQLSSEIREVVKHVDPDAAWATHGPDPRRVADRSMRAGTKLYELYIALQGFIHFRRRVDSYKPARQELTLSGFHNWFSDAVQNWFIMAKIKSKLVISNAFEVDVQENSLKPLDKVKHSSSAVDVSGCVKQIKNFWRELDWPDKAASYPLIIKILEAICDCALHYARLCHKKMEEASYFDAEGQFDVSEEVCVLLSNVEFVRNFIKTLCCDLRIDDVLKAIAENEGEGAAVQCQSAVEAMVQSTDEDVVNKILDIICGVANKIRPELRRCVYRVAWESESKGTETALTPLYDYLEENLANLYSNLEHVNFYRVTQTIWRVILEEIRVLVWENRGARPAFTGRIDDAVDKIAMHLYSDGNGLSMMDIFSPKYKETKAYLAKVSSPSMSLIEDYFVSRIELQNNRAEAISKREHTYGFLTVKAAMLPDRGDIYIYVLQARDLLAMDKNGFSDPYVKIELLPKHLFPQASVQKTKVVNKTLNPVWAEELSIKLVDLTTIGESNEDSEIPLTFGKPACVRFTVMDRDMLFTNDFQGECFLPLRDLAVLRRPGASAQTALQNLDLPLSQPLEEDEILEILEKRDWDNETARSFAKEERCRKIAPAKKP